MLNEKIVKNPTFELIEFRCESSPKESRQNGYSQINEIMKREELTIGQNRLCLNAKYCITFDKVSVEYNYFY